MRPRLNFTIRDEAGEISLFIYRVCDGEPLGFVPLTSMKMMDTVAELAARVARKARREDP